MRAILLASATRTSIGGFRRSTRSMMRQAEPGCKITPASEDRRWWRESGQSRRGEDTDARNRHQPARETSLSFARRAISRSSLATR